jgi:hypothetical protein
MCRRAPRSNRRMQMLARSWTEVGLLMNEADERLAPRDAAAAALMASSCIRQEVLGMRARFA